MPRKSGGVNFLTVREIGHTFADVEDGLSYRMPALKVKGKSFVHFRDELDSIVLKMPSLEQRDELLATEPQTYYITDHYRDYPALLVRLSAVSRTTLEELLAAAYELARQKPRAPRHRAPKVVPSGVSARKTARNRRP